jgi:hypothetical protein
MLANQINMARMKHGPYGPIVGKLGNTVGYIRLGEACVRTLTPPNKNKIFTQNQIAAFDKMRVLMEFVSSVNSFTNTSFKLAVKGTNKIAQNAAVSLNIKTAIKGVYPNLELDYSKIIVSKGDLDSAQHPVISKIVEAPIDKKALDTNVSIKFQWDIDPTWDNDLKRDQVMLLAYLPDNKTAFYKLSGSRRSEGEDTLQGCIAIKNHGNTIKDRFIETYIAFISDDRESISDSIYTGRIDL